MKKLFLFATVASLFLAEAGTLTAKIARDHKILATDTFAGGARTRFEFAGCEAWVVEPPEGVAVARGKPWTWTMQWATAFVSRTPVNHLLKRGWHHVTIMTFPYRMDEKGLQISRQFQDYLVRELGFAPGAALIGMSWGGFFSTRYAKYNPGCVKAIYYDCPLMNFDRGGYTNGKGDGPWTSRVPPEGWGASPEMPVNMAGAIVAQDIPVMLLYGGVDTVVPPAMNCELFIPRYKRLGGENLTVVKRGMYAHHPHGVEETDVSIADFFERAFARAPRTEGARFALFSGAVKKIMAQRKIDLKAAVKLLAENGVTGFDAESQDEMIPKLTAAGMKIAALYGRVAFDTADLGRAEAEAFVNRAAAHGAKRVLVIPENFKPAADAAERERVSVNIVNGLRQMCAYAAKKDVIVTVEDFGTRENICAEGKAMSRLLASEPRLAFTVDSSNFHRTGFGTDVVAFLSQWQDRLAHVHLKDKDAHDAKTYRTLGEGCIPNAEIIRITRDLGYRGWYTLEAPVGEDVFADVLRQRAFVLKHLK